jgi:hypothetical protein
VDEILRLLARELVASGAKATAVALACSCKSFEDPALDALWETQYQLLPLLESLPGDVWNEDGYTVSVPTTRALFSLNHLDRQTFRRLPTIPEWTRFQKNARRMRMLRESGDPRFPSSEVFAALQLCGINESLFPNLGSLELWNIVVEFIPFVPSFLSPPTTVIDIEFGDSADLPKAAIVSMVTTFPTLCPNLQKISLFFLPRDPKITTAVSELLLNTNRGALRYFHVDSPLTKEAYEVIYKLPELCKLWVVVEGSASLSTIVLPNLTEIGVEYDHNFDWLEGFRGATFGKLDSVTFYAKSKSAQIANFLEAFESVGFTTSTTLATFRFYACRSWRPNYHSLLLFTQLRELKIQFSCERGCSSTIDDAIIADMARVMPKMETLRLGEEPCGTPTGVTAKGLTILAHYCPNLFDLCIHFRVDSLSTLPAISGTPRVGSAAPRRDCALERFHAGETPMPGESVLMAALTLARIFPCISSISRANDNWKKVLDAICISGQIVDRTSKEHSPVASRTLVTPSQELHSRVVVSPETVRNDSVLNLTVSLAQRKLHLLVARLALCYLQRCSRE